MIQAIRPTSKASLLLQCLWASKGDVEDARKLYGYFADALPELPDYDPVSPNWQQSTKETVNGVMAWLKENQETLANGYEFIRNVIANRGAVPEQPATPLPPINDDV